MHPAVASLEGRLIRSHALAAVSLDSNPELYLECVMDLWHHYQTSLRSLPLIINTPGWILGTGLDTLTEMIKRMRPSEVAYMSEDGPVEAVVSLQTACREDFSMLPTQQSEFTSRTAKQLRAMQTMSYFHMRIDPARGTHTNEDAYIDWDPTPLTAREPWVVKYSGEERGFLALLFYDQQPLSSLITETINGMILTAVEVEDLSAFRDVLLHTSSERDEVTDIDIDIDFDVEDDTQRRNTAEQALKEAIARTSEGIPFVPNPDSITLDPKYSQSIGLVLVRGIDVENRCLHLLTPIPMVRIEQARANGRHIVLVHGKFDTPSWAYTEDLYLNRSGGGVDGPDDGAAVQVLEDDTENDDSEAEPENPDLAEDIQDIPWVEMLRRNEKRPAGSKVWRVRRDLGRTPGRGD
jgi:polynucleotide 5'-hydroxyl-kinase GRC3/NOL9